MLEIKQFLGEAGLECIGHRIGFSELCAGPFPMIAHMITETTEHRELPHWVVVEHADARDVKLYEGSGFQAVLPAKIFKKEWGGTALRISRPRIARRPSFIGRCGEGHSWLQFDTLFVDAGDISQSEEGHVFVFPFQNCGKGDLRLLEVKPGCKCVVVKDNTERVIRAGDRGEIVIQYTFEANRGRFRKFAMVKSDDPYFPYIRLTLSGNGRREVKISPTSLRFGEVPKGEKAVTECFLTYTGDSVFEIKGTLSSALKLQTAAQRMSPELVKRLEPGADRILLSQCQNRFMLSASIDTNNLELGPKKYKVRVLTNLEDTPELTIPVSIRVVPNIRAVPDCLFVGELSEGDVIHESITVRSLRGEKIRVNQVDLHDTNLTCSHLAISDGIEFTFKGVALTRTQLADKSIIIKLGITGSPKTFRIVLPIRGRFNEELI